MNGNFTLVTVPGMGEKIPLKEIPPKSAANGKLETDAYTVRSVDIHSIGFYWIVGLA